MSNYLSRYSLLSLILRTSALPEEKKQVASEMASLEALLAMNGEQIMVAWEHWLAHVKAAHENSRFARSFL